LAFPAAPVALETIQNGRAWWPLDMIELQRALMERDYALLTTRVPDGLVEARERVTKLLEGLEREHGVTRDKLVLGGFSQGAMIATDVALHLQQPPAALVVFSGSLICKDEWVPRMKGLAGIPVLQSHGRADPILSYELAERLRDELTAAGVSVDFHAFNGGHGIPDGAVSALGQLVTRVTA
jgi:phospholipase/carboxylesterase